MRPSRAICAAREDFLKLCHLEINTTRGLTRRKSDGVLKKMVIAPTLNGKCVRANNCPQSGIYRLRKGDDLFFFFLETPPILRAEIPHCQRISQNCELMQFLLYHAAVRDNKPWPSTTLEMANAALRLKSLPTPGLYRHIVVGQTCY